VTYAGIAVYGVGGAIAGAVMIQIQLAALALIFYPGKEPPALPPAPPARPSRPGLDDRTTR